MGVEIKNAVIEKATLSNDDRGFLTVWMHLNYGGTGQGFGGYALYLPRSFQHHEIKSVAGHFINRCLDVAGVSDWSKLAGRTIRVRASHTGVEAIGHIINDDWFCPNEDFALLEAN